MDRSGRWGASATVCPACQRAIVRLVESIGDKLNSKQHQVWPKGTARAPLPSEVTAEFSEDYVEACNVLSDSPKASAALSRRCLQHLLREKAGTKKKDLFDQIQEVLDSRSLPTNLSENLDSVRVIGNIAAHTIKSTSSGEIVDVEPGEAEWSLDVLEELFDYYLVAPARSQAKRDALKAKLDEAKKPPLKT